MGPRRTGRALRTVLRAGGGPWWSLPWDHSGGIGSLSAAPKAGVAAEKKRALWSGSLGRRGGSLDAPYEPLGGDLSRGTAPGGPRLRAGSTGT